LFIYFCFQADKDKGQSALLKGSNAVPATGIDLEFETDGWYFCIVARMPLV